MTCTETSVSGGTVGSRHPACGGRHGHKRRGRPEARHSPVPGRRRGRGPRVVRRPGTPREVVRGRRRHPRRNRLGARGECRGFCPWVYTERRPIEATHSSIMELFKRCPRCGVDKARSDFSRNRCEKDGQQVYCKECVAGISAHYYRRRREALGKTVRERVEVPPGHKYCPGCRTVSPLTNWHLNGAMRDGYASYCKGCRKLQGQARHLRRTFGITIGERDALFARP